MTRIGHQNLTASNLTGRIQYPDRNLEYLVFYNNNPAPLYVRLGSPEIPNQRNYDISVPPNYIMAISVNSNQFGFRLGDDTVITALLTGNTVVEGMIDEAPPALGGVPINAASLGTADLAVGFQPFAGVSTVGPFNLSLWGGATIFLLPTATTSGQGVIDVQVSSDNATWRSYGTWAFWPGVPISINVPRVGSWFRFILNATAIAGEPAIGGFYSVRATLAEVLQVDFNPSGNQYSKAYAFGALGSQTIYYVTAGLPSVILRLNVAAGARQEMVWYTGPTASGPWSLAAFREQSVAGFYNSIYRSLGSLDNFLRVDILDIGNNAGSGTLAVSVPGAPDLTAMLQNIYSALGDTGQPVNANQSIYHELDSIRAVEVANLPTLNTIATNVNNVHADLIHNTGIAIAAGNFATPTAGYVNLGAAANLPVNSKILAVQLEFANPNLATPSAGSRQFFEVALGNGVAASVVIGSFTVPTLGGFDNAGIWQEVYARAGTLLLNLSYPAGGGFPNGSFQNVWVSQTNFAVGNTSCRVTMPIQT